MFSGELLENEFILWHRVDTQGHDACRLEQLEDGWRLSGTTAFIEEQQVGNISYDVRHGKDWFTRSATVSGWMGDKDIAIHISRQPGDSWTMNGVGVPEVEGCIDLDLGLTPATNTSAVRRLNLQVGQGHESMAAWLDPSDWQLKPLQQIYVRRSPLVYAYSSPAHGFSAKLSVNKTGFVTDYPGIWLST
jgi:hypothetical protein